MLRRLSLFIVLLSALVVVSTCVTISILVRPLSVGPPIIIFDPYDNISKLPYASVEVSGSTISINITDVSTVYFVPFAVGYLTTPLQEWTSVTPPEYVYYVCVDFLVKANNTVSVSTVEYDINTSDSGDRAIFGLLGLLISKSIFESYGYNNTFYINTKFRITYGDGDTLYYTVVGIRNCTFVNSTLLTCRVYAYHRGEYSKLIEYNIYMINMSTISIKDDVYYMYLIPPEEWKKNVNFDETYYIFGHYTATSLNYDFQDYAISTLSGSGTSIGLTLCMHYSRGLVPGISRPPLLKVFPLIGAYLKISTQLNTQINITIEKIYMRKILLYTTSG